MTTLSASDVVLVRRRAHGACSRRIHAFARRTPLLAVVLVLAGCVGVGVRGRGFDRAQARSIAEGQRIEADLRLDGPVLQGFGRFDVYRFEAQGGRSYEIEATSTAFEPRVQVGRNVGGITEFLTERELSGRLRFRAPDTGSYLLVVGAPAEGRGAYSVAVAGIDELPESRLAEAERVDGRLVMEALPSIDSRVHVRARLRSAAFFRLRVATSQRVLLTARSDEFDTYLAIGRIVDGSFVEMASDDDGGDGLNSRLDIQLSEGDYAVRVTAVGERRGTYQLEVREAPPARPLVSRPLDDGRTGEGVLDENSATLDGFAVEQWSLAASGGTTYQVTLLSSDFDTYLLVGRMENGVFVEVASNDDAPELGTSSRVTFTASREGEYTVRVRAYGRSGRGRYTLRIEEPAGARPIVSRALRVGSEATGVLDAGSALLDGYPVEQWAFTSAAGAGYTITLRSEAFDTHLIVGQVREPGGEFVEIARNDDASGLGTDSRLTFHAATQGEYLVRVRPYGRDQRGEYRLLAEELPPVRQTPVQRRIRVGQQLTDSLVATDARLDSGSAHRVWIVPLRARQRFTIDLESDEFDTMLSVGVMDRGRFLEYARNDDGGDGTNSQLVMIAPCAGEYVIRVSAFRPEQFGVYTLRVEGQP